MLKRMLPAGFVVPAQPVERDKPPSGWKLVYEVFLWFRDGLAVTPQAVDPEPLRRGDARQLPRRSDA